MNEPKTIFLIERGILGYGSIWGAWKNWPNQSIVWLHQNTPFKAQTLLYFTGIIGRLFRKYRARQFAKLIAAYKGWKIHIISHSEGTATVLAALRYLDWPDVETLHLLNGAADANFERNGLNWALKRNRIGKVFVYIADRDNAMRIEDTIIGLLMFGIRWNDLPLGLSGARNVTKGFWDTRVIQKHWETYGHSDCWLPRHFDSTMLQIIGNSKALV